MDHSTPELSGNLPFVGDRVVVRYRLRADSPADWRPAPNPVTSGPKLSDVTGLVVALGATQHDGNTQQSGGLIQNDSIVLERDGVEVTIPRSAVTSVRTLSRYTVRNSDIRAVEHAAARAWPGTEQEYIGGWLLRAGGGFTRRANSALPLDRTATTDVSTMRAIADWYAGRDLPPLLAWPDRLLPATHRPGTASGPVQVLTAGLDQIESSAAQARQRSRPTPSVIYSDSPTTAWLERYHYGGVGPDPRIAGPVVAAGDGTLGFAWIPADTTVHSTANPVAIGRAAITEAPDGRRLLGITAIHTESAHRGRGLASAIIGGLVALGRQYGADGAYVQVEHDNRLAGAWYRRWGFGLHHEYRYIELGTSG